MSGIEDLRWLQFLYQEDIYLTADLKSDINKEEVVTSTSIQSPSEKPVVTEIEIPKTKPELVAIPKLEKTQESMVKEKSKVRVLVLVSALPMEASEAELFKNIFYNPKALALKEQEVKQITLDSLDNWQGEFVVSFGVSIPSVALTPYSPKTQGARYLMSDPLSKIAQDVELKRKLWTSLQEQFSKK